MNKDQTTAGGGWDSIQSGGNSTFKGFGARVWMEQQRDPAGIYISKGEEEVEEGAVEVMNTESDHVGLCSSTL